MNKITFTNARYEAVNRLVTEGISLDVVADPAGRNYSNLVGELFLLTKREDDSTLKTLLSAARLLRWRLMMYPQPIVHNEQIRDASSALMTEILSLRGSMAEDVEVFLHSLESAVQGITSSDPPAGAVLLDTLTRSAEESETVVVAINASAAKSIEAWLRHRPVSVRVAGDLSHELQIWRKEIVVGPPRFFPSGLLTAPSAPSVIFVLPDWFRDQSLPHSRIAEYADGPIVIWAKESSTPTRVEEPETTAPQESDLLPQPIWDVGASHRKEPGDDELEVRLVLLSGELAIFLDDGERIRCLDPTQPKGERVNFTDVRAVGVGTYLLLREGQTERGFLYEEALRLMGRHRRDAEASQLRWKLQLQERLFRHGLTHVEEELQRLGVRTIDRIRAWTDNTLVRPQRVQDFEILLEWLGVPVESTLALANELRRTRSKASADIRDRLEGAVDESDLTKLEVTGYLKIDLGIEGVRGIIATRVLAISPTTQLVSRADARIPFRCSRSKWLE